MLRIVNIFIVAWTNGTISASLIVVSTNGDDCCDSLMNFHQGWCWLVQGGGSIRMVVWYLVFRRGQFEHFHEIKEKPSLELTTPRTFLSLMVNLLPL